MERRIHLCLPVGPFTAGCLHHPERTPPSLRLHHAASMPVGRGGRGEVPGYASSRTAQRAYWNSRWAAWRPSVASPSRYLQSTKSVLCFSTNPSNPDVDGQTCPSSDTYCRKRVDSLRCNCGDNSWNRSKRSCVLLNSPGDVSCSFKAFNPNSKARGRMMLADSSNPSF